MLQLAAVYRDDHFDSNSEEVKDSTDQWFVKFEPKDNKLIDTKYHNLGWKFKCLKAAFNKADGSFLKMLLYFPYMASSRRRLESESSKFFVKPRDNILNKIWNTPDSIPIVRNSIEFISKKVKTKHELFFRHLFPFFSFCDIESGNYR